MADFPNLDPAQISLRIKTARDLRGVSQVRLGELFEEDGLNRSDPGRIERMDPKVPFRRAHLDAVCRHLRMPERWFVEENVDVIVGLHPETPTQFDQILDRLDTLKTQQGVLTELERERLAEVGSILNRLGRDVGRGRPLQRSGQTNPQAANEPAA
jgi:hypothetical protein